jgi:small subunit ribosomal protein S11
MEEEKKVVVAPVKKKKAKRTVSAGQVHIKSTFNNTIITFTEPNGATLVTSSSGACGFRGSKKSTAFAAQIAMEKAASLVKQNYSLSKVDVFVKGLGLGREAAIRSLQTSDIYVNSISDVTGLPHGGCRPRKARRQ